MKQKDLIYLSIAIVLFVVSGVLAYSQLGFGKKTFGHKATVEVIRPILPDLSSEGLDSLTNAGKTKDFMPPVDLLNGLGNPKPFNSL